MEMPQLLWATCHRARLSRIKPCVKTNESWSLVSTEWPRRKHLIPAAFPSSQVWWGAYKAFRLPSYSATLLICAVEVPMEDSTSSFPPTRYRAPESLVLEMSMYSIQREESYLLSANKIKLKAQRHLTLIFCCLWGNIMSLTEPQ